MSVQPEGQCFAWSLFDCDFEPSTLIVMSVLWQSVWWVYFGELGDIAWCQGYDTV